MYTPFTQQTINIPLTELEKKEKTEKNDRIHLIQTLKYITRKIYACAVRAFDNCEQLSTEITAGI